MKLEAGEEAQSLQVTAEDMRELRRLRERSELIFYISSGIIVVFTFLLGYFESRSSVANTYPFSAAVGAPILLHRDRVVTWPKLLVVSLVAFFALLLGAASASPSNLGVTTYYGTYSRPL